MCLFRRIALAADPNSDPRSDLRYLASHHWFEDVIEEMARHGTRDAAGEKRRRIWGRVAPASDSQSESRY